MDLKKQLQMGKTKISVVGLGYVGISIAYAFSSKVKVIGYDINEDRINQYKAGFDVTTQVGNEKLKGSTIYFTNDAKKLSEAKFHIIAVPTPVKEDNTPDISYVENASRTVGRNLTKGSVVVYESTVYPGATREICIPILENESNLVCGRDFTVGYSPERINPADKNHNLGDITKIVSGINQYTVELIAEIYNMVLNAGIYKAESLEVAEAAKIVENTQRDINIAFLNEISMIFNKLEIDTKAVLNAAATKWNFVKMYPGLVGGHCIGVDPYYLIYKSNKHGYEPKIISTCRKLNNDMSQYIVDNTIYCLKKANIEVENAKIAIMGFSFKENCNDIRNTKIIDIYYRLKELHIKPYIFDPIVNEDEAMQMYGIKLNSCELVDMDAIIFAVAHNQYSLLNSKDMETYFTNRNKSRVIIDIKGIFDKEKFSDNYIYWRL